MAVKFSDFTTENNAANITSIVGYTSSGNLNVQIPPANLNTTYTLESSASGDNVVLTLDGTIPGGTATDDTITITKGTGITFSSITAAGFTIAASGGGVTSFTNTNGTFVSAATANSSATGAVTTGVIDLSATGTPSASNFLRGDNTWATPAGSFTGFSITDGATTEVVANGDTITFAGGTYINTAVTATDTVTITLDTAVALWTLAGGDGAGPTQSITPGNTATIKENTSTTVNSVIVGGGVQSLAANTDELLLDQKSEQVITVAGSVFVVDGASQPTIVLPRGFTYEFNQDDSSNNSHPIVIGTAAASSPYATGIQYYGSTSANTLTPVDQSVYANSTNFNSYATRRVRLRITQNTPALYYYCSVHGASYGGSIAYGGATGLATMTTSPAATGNGSTATYPLGATPTDKNYTMAYISGVYQLKSSYSVSGSNITFDTNVPNGASIEIITTT